MLVVERPSANHRYI